MFGRIARSIQPGQYFRIGLIAVSILCVAAGLIWRVALADFVFMVFTRPQSTAVLIGIVVLWFLVSQLFVVPIGTVSVLLSGALLGWWIGLIYFGAMIISGVFVFTLARLAPEKSLNVVKRIVPPGYWQRTSSLMLLRMQARPIQATIILRLFPLAPSAACPLVIGASGGSIQSFLAGTLLAGWVRPVSLAVVGDSLGAVWLSPFELLGTLSQPILLISIGSLVLTSLALHVWKRN
jgi:uncharacterized membrane protein YdjX (TVP38/TMEM64 family)